MNPNQDVDQSDAIDDIDSINGKLGRYPSGSIYDDDTTGTSTEHLSKLVMLRGERHDELVVTKVCRILHDQPDIPDRATIVQRTNPYYGPKLVIESEGRNYLLTAPAPDTQLLLWASRVNNENQRVGWERMAEITARLADSLPPYEFCPQCNEPLKTLRHEKQAELGCCPNR